MADKIILAQLDLDIQGLLKAANESKLAVTQLKNELLAMKAAGEETSGQFRQAQDALQKLTTAMDAQIEALKQQIKKNSELTQAQKETAQSAMKLRKEQENLTDAYGDAGDALEGLTRAAREAKEAMGGVNTTMAQSGSAASGGTKTFNDYKKLFTESAQSINIFNGNFGDFISGAQQAGGVGPLVTNAFNGMAAGIGGMTKAALSFLATPLGMMISALAAVLSPVINYLKNTQEGIDRITAVTRPLQAIFNALMDVFQNVGKAITDAVTNPQKTIVAFGDMIKENITNRIMGLMELVPNLGKAIGLLFEGEFSKAGKVAADALGKVALGTDNITDKVAGAAGATGKFLSDAYNDGKKLDDLQKALDKGLAEYTKRTGELKNQLDAQNSVANDTNKTFEERETAAQKAIVTAREHSKLMAERLTQEIELLRLKQASNGASDTEKAALAEMVAKRDDALAQGVAAEKSQSDKLGAIRQEQADKAREARQKALDDNLAKQKLELDLLVAQQGIKAKTLKEELELAQTIAGKKRAIAQAEFNASKKTENDKIRLQLANQEISNGLAEAQMDMAVSNADKVLQDFKANNQSKLDANKFLTEEMVKQEKDRLDSIAKAETEYQEARLQAGVIQQEQFEAEKKRIADEADKEKKQVEADRDEALKTKEAIDLESKMINDTANHEYDLAFQLKAYDDKRAIEREAAIAAGADIIEFDKATAQERKDIDAAVMQNKLSLASQTFGNLAAIMGKESAAGKAMAVAQTTIDTYQAAQAAYKSLAGIPMVGPALGAVAAAAAVAGGMANVKKITATKPPKAEKGALFSIGGSRHSAGGTLFRGQDGTAFEAEQGELIGVMNRNAARHFMAFNNAFPAGGAMAPNYFAGGGIVSREIASPALNMDELALRIAEANRALPAPVVAVEDIITKGNSYVQVREGANF